jgi:hypothetical protein
MVIPKSAPSQLARADARSAQRPHELNASGIIFPSPSFERVVAPRLPPGVRIDGKNSAGFEETSIGLGARDSLYVAAKQLGGEWRDADRAPTANRAA